MNQQMNEYNQKMSLGDMNPPLSASSVGPRENLAGAGTGGSNNKCKFCKGNGYAPSSQSASDRQYQEGSARAELKSSGRDKIDHVVINLPLNDQQEYTKKKSDSFRKVFSQI